MSSSSRPVPGPLHALLARCRGPAADDRELLRRYAASAEEDAFAGLLERHGPMVLGLARRVVRDYQAAEDVFQATFLTLAKKAGAIRRPEALPCWLHGVAFRLALRAKRSGQRRRDREQSARKPVAPDPLDELSARELLAVLDEELQALPEAYRGPLILCCLEGLSQEEAARRLGCSPGALKGRLERGRVRLRLRLETRGLALSAALAVPLLAAGQANAVPPDLARATLRALAPGAAASPAVTALTCGALRMLFVNRLKAAGAVILLTAVAGLGMGLALLPAARTGEPAAPAAPDNPAGESGSGKRVDRYGDPLPDGAVMRLGTIRRRAVGALLAVSADGRSVVSVRAGKYVRVWDAATGGLRQSRELPGESWNINALSPDGRLLSRDGAAGERLTVWDVPAGKPVHTFTIKKSRYALPVAFSPDGKRLAAVGHRGPDCCVRVWDVATGKKVFARDLRMNCASSLIAISPDGKRLLASFGSISEGTYCWDLVTGRLAWQKKDFVPATWAFTPDGKVLSPMPQYPALDLATGRPARDVKMPRLTWDNRLTVSPDGRTLLASTGAGILVWDLARGKQVRTLAGAGEEALFTPDGRSVITNDGALQRWDLATGKTRYADTFALGHVGEVLTVAFAADGKRLASGSADGTVRLWNTTTGEPLRVWRAHEAARPTRLWGWREAGARAVAITPDGRRVLSAGGDERLRLWDAGAEKQVLAIKLPAAARGEMDRRVFCLRFTPDGARAVGLFGATAGIAEAGAPPPRHTNTLATWDLKTGALVTSHPIEKVAPAFNALSPDGRTLLSGALLIDAASGKELGRLEGVTAAGLDSLFAFSADGALVAGGFTEVTRKGKITYASPAGIRVWEAATGKTVASVKNPSWVAQLAFHPDNQFVVSNDLQGVRLWSVTAGKVETRLKMPEKVRSSTTTGSFAGCLAFAADGRLATGHPDGTILLWNLARPPAKPRPLAARERDSLWADLAGGDAARAWRAVWRLSESPKEVVPFLRDRLKPAATAPAAVVRPLLADLDSASYRRRQEAVRKLKALGLAAEPALRQALEERPSVEQRKRIEKVLAALADVRRSLSSEELRGLRAVAVLGRIGSPEARRILEGLTKGPDLAPLTRQARAALGR